MRSTPKSIIISVLGMAIASGCSSTPKGGNLDKALADYNAGRYSEAEAQAIETMNRSTGPAKEEGSYIAGLSAYRMGNRAEAERRFMLAAQSADSHIAGSAKAMLGQLRLDQNRPREAGTYFADASRLLEGEDAKQAARHAALAYQQAGDGQAQQQWMANSGSSGPPPIATAKGSTYSKPPIGFALQVGAFTDRKRAQLAANEAEPLAKRDGLGPVRVIPRRNDRGKSLYLVQFGFFTSRDAASAARTRVGRLEYIVTPVS